MNASFRTPRARFTAGAALLAISAASLPAHAAGSATLARHLAGAQDLGAVSPGTAMTATVQLPMADKAGFEAALAARYTQGSPLFRHWMTPADLASYGPSVPATSRSCARRWPATACW